MVSWPTLAYVLLNRIIELRSVYYNKQTMTLWLWVTGCLLPDDSGLCIWCVGVVRHGAVTGSGKRQCQLHCSFRVSAYTPCAQLRHTGCRPCQTAPHRGPSSWWGKWKHDNRLVPLLIFMPFCVCKCLLSCCKLSEDAFSWGFLIYYFGLYLLTEGNQGPSESKSGIQIKLYCVHTKWVIKMKKALNEDMKFAFGSVEL